MRNLSGLQSLVNIRLNGTDIDGAALSVLSEFPNLRTMELRQTNITDDDLRKLHSREGLLRVDLSGTHVTEAGVGLLKERLPRLAVDY